MKKRGKWNKREKRIIALAYCNRYGCFLGALAAMFLPNREIWIGIVSFAWGLYRFVGYKLKWKHIYCSYQDAYHQKMTPNRMKWSMIKKSDAYGIPAFFCIMGIALIMASILEKP